MTILKYPLSAANGRAIPIDVLGPVSYNVQLVTTSNLFPLIQDAGFEEHLIQLICDQDVLVLFSDDATAIGANDTIGVLCEADKLYTIAPPLAFYTVTSLSASGTALINTISRWDTLTTEIQIDQG